MKNAPPVVRKWVWNRMNQIDTLNRIIYNRILQYNYDLENWSQQQMGKLLPIIKASHGDIISYLHTIDHSAWSVEDSVSLLDNFYLSVVNKSLLKEYIIQLISTANENALLMYNDILSFGGQIKLKETVSTDIQTTNFGDRSLQEWVDSIYDYNIRDQVKKEIFLNILDGNSFTNLLNRIEEGLLQAESHAIMIADTYIQVANTKVQDSLYKNNFNLIEGVQWSSALEISKNSTICIRCAALDGNFYKSDDIKPETVVHLNCNCFTVPILKHWKEFKININDYVKYSKNQPNNYEQYFNVQSDSYKKKIVGPKRFKLLKNGKIKFKDLVDRSTGRLLTLKEL